MPSYNLVIALPTADRSSAYALAQALGFETPGELTEDGVPEPLRLQLNEQASVMSRPLGSAGSLTAAPPRSQAPRSACSACRWALPPRSTAWSGASMRPAVGWSQIRSRRPGATPERSPTLTVTCGKPSSRRSDPAVGSGAGGLRRHLCASARLLTPSAAGLPNNRRTCGGDLTVKRHHPLGPGPHRDGFLNLVFTSRPCRGTGRNGYGQRPSRDSEYRPSSEPAAGGRGLSQEGSR